MANQILFAANILLTCGADQKKSAPNGGVTLEQ